MDEEEQSSVHEQTTVDTQSVTTIAPIVSEKPLDPPKYEVRPLLGERFQGQNVRDIILSTMQEQLMGRSYRNDQAPGWAKAISNSVRQRVQQLDMKRFKILVQTTIIEMKGAGVRLGQRCLWDPETDDYAAELYRNDTIFCHTTVYGVYMY